MQNPYKDAKPVEYGGMNDNGVVIGIDNAQDLLEELPTPYVKLWV